MRIIHLLLILLLISCSDKKKKNSTISEQKTKENTTIESNQETETFNLLENGLMSNLNGNWISTIITDSIPKTRQILKWKSYFLGNLMISIKENDTLIISGERYRDQLKYEVIDSKSLVLPNWDSIRIVYSPEKDLIYFGGKKSSHAYKRITGNDFDKIISSEDLLMKYMINLLFQCDYLPKDFSSKIKYIALDLETYYRFTFDAIGLENQIGEIEYYGWKFIGDTLNLYRTSSVYDEDSESTSYKLEETVKQYFKNN